MKILEIIDKYVELNIRYENLKKEIAKCSVKGKNEELSSLEPLLENTSIALIDIDTMYNESLEKLTTVEKINVLGLLNAKVISLTEEDESKETIKRAHQYNAFFKQIDSVLSQETLERNNQVK